MLLQAGLHRCDVLEGLLDLSTAAVDQIAEGRELRRRAGYVGLHHRLGHALVDAAAKFDELLLDLTSEFVEFSDGLLGICLGAHLRLNGVHLMHESAKVVASET